MRRGPSLWFCEVLKAFGYERFELGAVKHCYWNGYFNYVSPH
jgi:hypothetical protein